MEKNNTRLLQYWLKKGLVGIIHLYRLYMSPYLKPSCRFYPSCSQYALDVLEVYSFPRSLLFITRRLLKCHPWGKSGSDPILPPTKPTN